MKYILAFLMIALCACRSEDYATPTENEQLLELNNKEEGLLIRLEAGDDVTAELAEVRARRDEIEKRIRDRTVSGWLSWLPIPLPEPLKEVLVGSIGLLAFDRPRQNAKKGIKALFKADWKTAALTPIRALGLMHTNNDPLDVLRGAKAAAVARGNTTLATLIEREIIKATNYEVEAVATSSAPVGPPAHRSA